MNYSLKKAPNFAREDFKYQLLPPLKDAEWVALIESIKQHGVEQPVEIDEDGNILDGHHRYIICNLLKIDCPTIVKEGLTEEEKRGYARRVNIQRRHLNGKQKRSIIAELLLDDETRSNNSIAKELGVSDATVGKVREDLGLNNRLRKGEDGKLYLVPESHYSSTGTLLDKIDEKLNPRNVVEYGFIYKAGEHILAVLNIMNEWETYVELLLDLKSKSNRPVVFFPYPGPFIAATRAAQKYSIVMIQPMPYIAGHILDAFEDFGFEITLLGGERKNDTNWRQF